MKRDCAPSRSRLFFRESLWWGGSPLVRARRLVTVFNGLAKIAGEHVTGKVLDQEHATLHVTRS